MDFTDFRCKAIEQNLGTDAAVWADRNAAGWVLDRLADPIDAQGAAERLLPAGILAKMKARAAGCPGCSGAGVMTDDPQVAKCERCGGFFTTDFNQPIAFEAALKFVALGQPMLANAGPDGQFYFDLAVATTWRGKPEVGRVHGWADAKTKRVVQFG